MKKKKKKESNKITNEYVLAVDTYNGLQKYESWQRLGTLLFLSPSPSPI
jgi:hypothetical protein